MGNPAPYRVVAIATNRTHEVSHTKAPSAYQLAEFGKRREAEFVVRYFPSKKAWRVLDIRKGRKITVPGRPAFWDSRSIPYIDKLFPSEDAAVMWAMHQTGLQIDL